MSDIYLDFTSKNKYYNFYFLIKIVSTNSRKSGNKIICNSLMERDQPAYVGKWSDILLKELLTVN